MAQAHDDKKLPHDLYFALKLSKKLSLDVSVSLSDAKMQSKDLSEDEVLELVQQYVEKEGNDIINTHLDNGLTLFHHALKGNNVSVVFWLLQNGADLNILTLGGESTISVMYTSPSAEIMQPILENWQDILEYDLISYARALKEADAVLDIEDDGIVGSEEPAEGGAIVPYDEPAAQAALGVVEDDGIIQ